MEKEERRSGIHAIIYDVAKEPDDYVKEEEKKRSVAEDVVVMRVDSEKQGIATEEKRSRIVAVEEKRNEVERQMMATEEESMRCFNAEEAQSEAYETQMMAKEEENSRYVTAEEAQREAYEAQMMAKEEENSRCVAVEEVQREDNEAQMMAKEEERMRVLLAEEEKLLDACLEQVIDELLYCHVEDVTIDVLEESKLVEIAKIQTLLQVEEHGVEVTDDVVIDDPPSVAVDGIEEISVVNQSGDVTYNFDEMLQKWNKYCCKSDVKYFVDLRKKVRVIARYLLLESFIAFALFSDGSSKNPKYLSGIDVSQRIRRQ